MLVTDPKLKTDSSAVIADRGLRFAGIVASYVRAVETDTLRSLPAGSAVNLTARFFEVDPFEPTHQVDPAGFRVDVGRADAVTLDLVGDIGCDAGDRLRPTPVLFSADSANPYEIGECRDLIANVKCNPGIVYDLSPNYPQANLGGGFQSLERGTAGNRRHRRGGMRRVRRTPRSVRDRLRPNFGRDRSVRGHAGHVPARRV